MRIQRQSVRWRISPRCLIGSEFHSRMRSTSLSVILCNFVLGPIIELGRSRRLVSGHLLCVLKPSVVFQVNRDTGCPPCVASDGSEKTAAFARFRIATGVPRSEGLRPQRTLSGSARAGDVLAFRAPGGSSSIGIWTLLSISVKTRPVKPGGQAAILISEYDDARISFGTE